MAKEFREDVNPAVTEARRQALVQLLRAAGQAVDAGGSRESLERLEASIAAMDCAWNDGARVTSIVRARTRA